MIPIEDLTDVTVAIEDTELKMKKMKKMGCIDNL